jgi:hypothetical protein
MKTKSSQIIKEQVTINFTCRVYKISQTRVKIVLMNEDSHIHDGGEFAIICGHIAVFDTDYIDENHVLQIDENGMQYTVWKNSEFPEPFTLEDIIERLEYYQNIEN